MKNRYYAFLVLFLGMGSLFSCSPSNPKPLSKPLMDLEEALERRDVNAVKYWTHEYRHNTTLRFPHGVTPLMLAAKTGNEEILRAALNTDWDVNARDSEQNTPLHWAVMYKKPKAVEILIAAGAKIDPDGIRETPLNLAIKNKDVEMVKLLIHLGANINKVDNEGTTPLMIAASRCYTSQTNFTSIVGILLNNGSEMGLQNKSGQSALSLASKEFCPNDVQLLIDAGEDVNNNYKSGAIPLLIAAEHCDNITADVLIKAGADVSVRTKDNETPLIVTGRSHCIVDEDTVRVYIGNGVDVLAQDNNGVTIWDIVSKDPLMTDHALAVLKDEITRRKNGKNI